MNLVQQNKIYVQFSVRLLRVCSGEFKWMEVKGNVVAYYMGSKCFVLQTSATRFFFFFFFLEGGGRGNTVKTHLSDQNCN